LPEDEDKIFSSQITFALVPLRVSCQRLSSPAAGLPFNDYRTKPIDCFLRPIPNAAGGGFSGG